MVLLVSDLYRRLCDCRNFKTNENNIQMTREKYIERLIAIFKLRYKPSQEEIEEFKLLMEMMPNNIESIGVPYTKAVG